MRALSIIRRPAVRDFFIFFAFFELTVLMTWPWVRHLRDAASDAGDPYFMSYILWWDYHQTFHDPLRLFHATIFYPHQYTLAFSENCYGIALPFFALFALGLRPLTVHAVASLTAFAFSGYGMFRLARTLTGSNGVAWIAGVIFAFIPYRFHQLPHLIYMFAGWIPLLLEAQILFLRERSKRRALWLGIAFLMNGLTCIHWFVLTLIPLALSAAFLIARQRIWKDINLWRRGLVALCVAMLLLFPFLYPYAQAAKLYHFVRSAEELAAFSASPIHWLVADERNKLWGNLNFREGMAERSLFPGLLPLLLGLAALFFVEPLARHQNSTGNERTPPKRVLIFLDALVILTAILLLLITGFADAPAPPFILKALRLTTPGGPFIVFTIALLTRLSLAYPEILRRIEGKNLLATLRSNRRPDAFWIAAIWIVTGFCGSLGMNFFFHRALFEYLQLFRSIRVPARWAMIAYVGLALLAGLGAQACVKLLARHWKGARAAALYAVMILAVLFEQRAAPLQLVRGAVFPNEVTLRLKRTQMSGGIVELPVGENGSDMFYVLRAADHERPLVTAYSGFLPPLNGKIYELTHEKTIPNSLIDLLESIPTSYLVIHNARLTPERRQQFESLLGSAVSEGRLRFIGRFEGHDDLYAITKTEPQARNESALPFSFNPLASPSSPNPIDEGQFFTRTQYADFLAREPDPDGLLYWTAQLSRCNEDNLKCFDEKRVNVSTAFVEQGLQETGLFIYSFYYGLLGRPPRYDEFVADRRFILKARDTGAGKINLAAEWAKRAEFQKSYPVNLRSDEFIEALIRNLGRTTEIDIRGQRDELVRLLESGNRKDVVREILNNADLSRAVYNRAFVLAAFFGYFKREPDEAGYDFWLLRLNAAPDNHPALIQSFINSDEYRNRFIQH